MLAFASGPAAGADVYTLSPRTTSPVGDRHSDEADIPTEEAQARPCTRVSLPHADAGRAVDAEAAPLKGPQAPHGLSVVDRRYAGTGRRTAGRLSRSAEFDRVYRQGRSVANRYLVLYTFPRSDGDAPRVGLSVGRRVGGAVERNRVKRLLRDAFGEDQTTGWAGFDVVVVARPPARELAEAEGLRGIQQAVAELLGKAGVRVGRTA